MQRLEDPKNNCTFELRFSLKKKNPKDIIVVLLEKGIGDQNKWKDNALFSLGNHLYIDLSVENADANFQKLVEEIRMA